MNAGRDVERLVSKWLAEQAEVRAPDRVLDSSRRTIDRTVQRRWVAAWREPVTLTMTRLVALAATLAIAIGGAAWLGRATAPGIGGTPTPMPVATSVSTSPAPAVTLATYQAARDEICVRYRFEINRRESGLDELYDPNLPAIDRTAKTATLVQLRDHLVAMVAELGAIPAPPELAAENTSQLGAYNSTLTLLSEVLTRLEKKKYTEARAMDLATDPFSRAIGAYETKHGFLSCP